MNYKLSRRFLTKEPIYNLTLETNASFPMYECCFYHSYCYCKVFAKYEDIK